MARQARGSGGAPGPLDLVLIARGWRRWSGNACLRKQPLWCCLKCEKAMTFWNVSVHESLTSQCLSVSPDDEQPLHLVLWGLRNAQCRAREPLASCDEEGNNDVLISCWVLNLSLAVGRLMPPLFLLLLQLHPHSLVTLRSLNAGEQQYNLSLGITELFFWPLKKKEEMGKWREVEKADTVLFALPSGCV